MSTRYSTQILGDEGGTFLQVYTDDDGASGYGDNAMVGCWYGPPGPHARAACEAMAKTPEKVKLYPMAVDESPDPFELACERRYD